MMTLEYEVRNANGQWYMRAPSLESAKTWIKEYGNEEYEGALQVFERRTSDWTPVD